MTYYRSIVALDSSLYVKKDNKYYEYTENRFRIFNDACIRELSDIQCVILHDLLSIYTFSEILIKNDTNEIYLYEQVKKDNYLKTTIDDDSIAVGGYKNSFDPRTLYFERVIYLIDYNIGHYSDIRKEICQYIII